MQPSWLSKSTVHADNDATGSPGNAASPKTDSGAQKSQAAAGSTKKS